MSLRLAALLAVAAFALAGCAAEPPAGTLKPLDYKLPVGGYVNVVYQPFTGANPTGAVPTAGPTTQCAQNQAADPPGMGPVQRCKGPYTTFAAQATLPPPTAGGYKLYAVGPGFELEGFSFKGQDGAYAGSANVTNQDLSSKVKEFQVRMDGVPLATVPGAAGNHTLALAPAIAALTVTGSFTGRHLEVTVAGLPANGTYMGRLYVADPASPTGFTAKEMFEVKEGTTAFESKERDIAGYGEFHLHVGDSMVNLYKAAITPAA
jgi:hypothetical protein